MSKSTSTVQELVGEGTFRQEVIEYDGPVFIDFWSPGCAPCKPMGVIFDHIASQYWQKAKFVKVNVRENKVVAQRFGIRSVPTLAALLNGDVVNVRVGFAPEKVIERFVRRTMDRVDGRTLADRIKRRFFGEKKNK